MRMQLGLLSLMIPVAFAQAQVTLTSPGGKAQTTVSRAADGRLTYSVRFNGHDVLTPSPIGVVVDGEDLGAGVELGKGKEQSITESFPWRGNHPEVNLRGRSVTIPIGRKAGAGWALEVRCFDAGVAYRCIIPGEGTRKVTGEAAAWNLAPGTFAWCNPDTKNYEGVYQRHAVDKIPAGEFKKGIGMPTTLELPGGGYGVLTEADTMAYSGMKLEPTDTLQLKSSFRDDPKGWSMTGEIKTPWRVLMLAPDLNALVNNDLVPALCPAPDKKLFPNGIRTDWLKPGRCLWQWWAYDDPGTHWSKQKFFVDKAAELNCQYYLVDEGWEHTRQEWVTADRDAWSRMKELCDYAAAKGVGIWVWRGYRYDEKRQWPGLETQEKRDTFFSRCAKVGIKGAKVDFMDNESHDRLAFYHDCLQTAAKYKVMVDYHGANKPAGESRTWPNEITREAVRGLEYNKWSALPPIHYATIPFTRFVVGVADFTPTTFQEKYLKGTTFAQQLACSVVFTSPFLCWADKPEVYLESPALDLIRTMPTVWDETIVLPESKIGELAAFARRSGKDWYVGVINGGKARDLTINFDFLSRSQALSLFGGGQFQADCFGDVTGEPAKFDVQKGVKVKAGTQRTIHLNDGGGWVARIRK
jgi:alpha-glucosidase